MRLAAALLLCIALCACGRSGDSADTAPDDRPFLDAIGFNKPLSLAVQLTDFTDENGIPVQNLNTHLVAALVQGKLLTFSPVRLAPWYEYTVFGAPLVGSQATFIVGTRANLTRSDERTWTDGTTHYFSETISYDIAPSPAFKFILQKSHQSFRLVLMFDRGGNAWVLDRSATGTTFNAAADANSFTSLLGLVDLGGLARGGRRGTRQGVCAAFCRRARGGRHDTRHERGCHHKRARRSRVLSRARVVPGKYDVWSDAAVLRSRLDARIRAMAPADRR